MGRDTFFPQSLSGKDFSFVREGVYIPFVVLNTQFVPNVCYLHMHIITCPLASTSEFKFYNHWLTWLADRDCPNPFAIFTCDVVITIKIIAMITRVESL